LALHWRGYSAAPSPCSRVACSLTVRRRECYLQPRSHLGGHGRRASPGAPDPVRRNRATAP